MGKGQKLYSKAKQIVAGGNMLLSDEKILGPITIPLFIAFLKEIVIESESPRLRTVVNPAISVFSAFLVALIA